jgi:hypothetical protein
MATWFNNKEVLQMLIENHADVSVLTPSDQNLLHAAIIGDKLSCLVYLSFRIDINLRNENRCTALITAAKYE